MSDKLTYSIPGVWDPDTEGNTEKLLAGSCEIGSMKLATTSTGSALVFLYDAVNAAGATDANLRWVLDSPKEGPDKHDFSYPLAFERGVYAKLMSGANFRPIVCLSRVLP